MDNHGIFDMLFSVCFYDENSVGMEERELEKTMILP